MKIRNLLIVIFLVATIQLSNAQTQEGKIQMSGYFSSTLRLGDNGGSSIFPSVTFGYFVNDHVLVRGEMVVLAQFNVINDERNVRLGLGYGMGGKYYFGETKLQPFIGLDAYYATNPDIFNDGVNYNHLDITLEPGVSYFLRENVAIEAALPFEYIRGMFVNTQNPNNSYSSNSFFSTLSIGFQIYLR